LHAAIFRLGIERNGERFVRPRLRSVLPLVSAWRIAVADRYWRVLLKKLADEYLKRVFAQWCFAQSSNFESIVRDIPKTDSNIFRQIDNGSFSESAMNRRPRLHASSTASGSKLDVGLVNDNIARQIRGAAPAKLP
jgi:hypothetical protein